MSAIKGEYRLARVREVYPDTKGLVRSAKVAYTIYKVGENREYLCWIKEAGGYTPSAKTGIAAASGLIICVC